jgi:hypothetical protein
MPEPNPPPTESESAAAEGLVKLAWPKSEEVARNAALEAAELASRVLFSWNALGRILGRHEDALRKRWLKKSKAWRRTLLSKAWPNIPLSHRPDIAYLAKEALQLGKDGVLMKRPVEPFMWPYINMEDLSSDKPILCLLNSRARNPPATFAGSELGYCRLGIESKTIIPLELEGYTMLLEGEGMDSYGKLVAAGVYNSLKAGFSPGDGLLILEIQERVMEFLVKWCELTLDKPIDVLMNQGSIVRQLQPLEISSPWPTLAIMAKYGPYFPPGTPDFSRLKQLLDARHAVAEHHIWALREDPGYFEDALIESREHRPEVVPDSAGRTHLTFETPALWNRVMLDVIQDAYFWLIIWDVLRKYAQIVIDLERKYAREIDPVKPLPVEYHEEVAIFRYVLLYRTTDALETMRFILPPSPPLRSLWVRDTVDKKMLVTPRDVKDGRDVDIEHDPLMWIYHKLRVASDCKRYGLKDLMDEMERLVFARPEQKKRISHLLARQIADIGLLAQIQHEIDTYHPWATHFRWESLLNQKWMDKDMPLIFLDYHEVSRKAPRLVLSRVGIPCDQKFFYPCDKRYTRANSHSMWKAEQNLDLFWQEVDRQYEQITGTRLDKAYSNRYSFNFELERVSELIEPFGETSEECGCKKAKAEVEGIIEPVFKLDTRALRVTKALFYEPSDFDGPEEIPWGDFLHFMIAMKFNPLKLHGNLWHFSNPFARHIQFHEPQPHSKIVLRVAMNMGRRLKRTYEWQSEMFGLDKGKSS